MSDAKPNARTNVNGKVRTPRKGSKQAKSASEAATKLTSLPSVPITNFFSSRKSAQSSDYSLDASSSPLETIKKISEDSRMQTDNSVHSPLNMSSELMQDSDSKPSIKSAKGKSATAVKLPGNNTTKNAPPTRKLETNDAISMRRSDFTADSNSSSSVPTSSSDSESISLDSDFSGSSDSSIVSEDSDSFSDMSDAPVNVDSSIVQQQRSKRPVRTARREASQVGATRTSINMKQANANAPPNNESEPADSASTPPISRIDVTHNSDSDRIDEPSGISVQPKDMLFTNATREQFLEMDGDTLWEVILARHRVMEENYLGSIESQTGPLLKELQGEKNKHLPSKTFTCPFCGVKLRTANAMIYHLKNAVCIKKNPSLLEGRPGSPELAPKPVYVCVICRGEFTNTKAARFHAIRKECCANVTIPQTAAAATPASDSNKPRSTKKPAYSGFARATVNTGAPNGSNILLSRQFPDSLPHVCSVPVSKCPQMASSYCTACRVPDESSMENADVPNSSVLLNDFPCWKTAVVPVPLSEQVQALRSLNIVDHNNMSIFSKDSIPWPPVLGMDTETSGYSSAGASLNVEATNVAQDSDLLIQESYSGTADASAAQSNESRGTIDKMQSILNRSFSLSGFVMPPGSAIAFPSSPNEILAIDVLADPNPMNVDGEQKVTSAWIAVSSNAPGRNMHLVGSVYSGLNVLQIWRVDAYSNATSTQRITRTLEYLVLHEAETIYDMQWCPYALPESMDSKDDGDDHFPRIGLLACAMGDGCMRVYSIPHPVHVRKQLDEPTSENTMSETDNPGEPTPLVIHLAPAALCFAPTHPIVSVQWSPITAGRIFCSSASGSILLFDMLSSPSTSDSRAFLRGLQTTSSHGFQSAKFAHNSLPTSEQDNKCEIGIHREKHKSIELSPPELGFFFPKSGGMTSPSSEPSTTWIIRATCQYSHPMSAHRPQANNICSQVKPHPSNSNIFASVHTCGSLHLWDARQVNMPIATWRLSLRPLTTLAWTMDGRGLLVGCDSGEIFELIISSTSADIDTLRLFASEEAHSGIFEISTVSLPFSYYSRKVKSIQPYADSQSRKSLIVPVITLIGVAFQNGMCSMFPSITSITSLPSLLKKASRDTKKSSQHLSREYMDLTPIEAQMSGFLNTTRDVTRFGCVMNPKTTHSQFFSKFASLGTNSTLQSTTSSLFPTSFEHTAPKFASIRRVRFASQFLYTNLDASSSSNGPQGYEANRTSTAPLSHSIRSSTDSNCYLIPTNKYWTVSAGGDGFLRVMYCEIAPIFKNSLEVYLDEVNQALHLQNRFKRHLQTQQSKKTKETEPQSSPGTGEAKQAKRTNIRSSNIAKKAGKAVSRSALDAMSIDSSSMAHSPSAVSSVARGPGRAPQQRKNIRKKKAQESDSESECRSDESTSEEEFEFSDSD